MYIFLHNWRKFFTSEISNFCQNSDQNANRFQSSGTSVFSGLEMFTIFREPCMLKLLNNHDNYIYSHQLLPALTRQ